MMRKTKRRKNYIMLLLLLVVSLGIGYALISMDLTITGTGKVNASSWNVYFDNLVPNQNNVTLSTGDVAASIDTSTNTDITFTVTLVKPGDFYEFTVDVVNDGSLDAMVGTITNNLNGNPISVSDPLPTFARYTATYEDGSPIGENHILEHGETETYKVRLEYRTDITSNDLPGTVQTLTLNFGVQYVQADENAYERPALIGSYFTMVPDASTYTIPSSITGYEVSGTPTNQTITPNELTLWRVININADGTVDAVSEYVSSTEVYFGSVTGYANSVGGLQTIASQYAKAGYTSSTRMMGYDGQTLTITDTSAFDGTTNDSPSTITTPSPYTGTGQEYGGGVLGDTLYLKDYQLVSNVYKIDTTTYGSNGLIAYKVNSITMETPYWLASRRFYYGASYPYFDFTGWLIDATGGLYAYNFRIFRDTWGDYYRGFSVRPVITLRSEVQFSGVSGTKTNPFTISV